MFGGHEEGGFFCINTQGEYAIDRWQSGDTSEIFAPPHPGGKRNNEIIVATFHTHPNTGRSHYQTPSPQDRAMVRNDPDLRHSEYSEEFVISQQTLYLTLPSGNVMVVGRTEELLPEKFDD